VVSISSSLVSKDVKQKAFQALTEGKVFRSQLFNIADMGNRAQEQVLLPGFGAILKDPHGLILR
jgi:hypothetical protein